MDLDTQYNYVIFGSDWDLYKIAYSSLLKYDNVRYIESPYLNLGILKQIRHVHFSGTLNRIFRVPFKGLWNSRYFLNDFRDDKPICFLFFWPWAAMEIETRFTSFLRKKFPCSRMVLFLQDVVSSLGNTCIDDIRNRYDLIVSYDKKDCEKYHFVYHPTVLSKIDITQQENDIKSDFYFIGQDKGRLKTLIGIYEQLSNNGFVCDFTIQGAIGADVQLPPGIKHIDNNISYFDNLQHVKNTKCIIELMQPNADGFTYRTWESIMYDKFLLTNNTTLSGEPFFNENNMYILGESDNLESFIERVSKVSYIDNDYKKQLSPEELLRFVDLNI